MKQIAISLIRARIMEIDQELSVLPLTETGSRLDRMIRERMFLHNQLHTYFGQ